MPSQGCNGPGRHFFFAIITAQIDWEKSIGFSYIVFVGEAQWENNGIGVFVICCFPIQWKQYNFVRSIP